MGRDEERRNKSQKVKKQEHLNSGVGEAISQVAKISQPCQISLRPFFFYFLLIFPLVSDLQY